MLQSQLNSQKTLLAGALDSPSDAVAFESLLSKYQGDKTLLFELLPLFQQELARLVPLILEMSAQNQWDFLRKYAHELKGLCALYCAEPMRQHAYALETACREEKEPHVDQMINDIQTDTQEVSVAVEDWLATTSIDN